jgi:hypothetical protein
MVRRHVNVDDASACDRSTLQDPTSFAPILLIMAGGILIVTGALTAAGKGPGARIQPGSRRSRARRRAKRQRWWLGAVLIVAGLVAFGLIFNPDFSTG